jgi:hypothetical protein
MNWILLVPVLLAYLAMVACRGSDREDAGQCFTFGDRQHPDDFCWDPPNNYCSGGAGAAIVMSCSLDGSECCELRNTCAPCGWSVCAPQCYDDGGCAIQELDSPTGPRSCSGDAGCTVPRLSCPSTLAELKTRISKTSGCDLVGKSFCR